MPASTQLTAAAPRRWWGTAGAWLGIGTSPAALVLGAGVAERHDGVVPVLVFIGGGLLMAALLVGQGYLGLVPPLGEGARLAEVTRAYLGPRLRVVVGWLLAVAMIGWLGFNVGLGGAALGRLTSVPDWAGATLLGMVLLVVALSGERYWNVLAVVTTVSALLLVAAVAWWTTGGAAPADALTTSGDQPSLIAASVAAFVGYVSVFAVRAPDFTGGLRGRSDLLISVALLVVPTVVVAMVGTLLYRYSGSTDLVAELERSAVGSILVVAAIIAPTLTAFHSGGLAISGVTRLRPALTVCVVGAAGVALAVVGFHHLLVPWLIVLGAALPPLVVAMGSEAWRRRRGGVPHPVPGWTWLPASAVALTMTAAGLSAAVLCGLAIAAASATVRSRRLTAGRPR